jgi:hypothetical protein
VSAAAVRRGREADRPAQIPRRGWLDVAYRVKDQLAEDNVSLLAAGLEHQTRRDSTVGPDQPMGQRGAYVADTLGEARK